MLINEFLEKRPELVGLLDQRVHSSRRLLDQSMILVNLLRKHIVHFLLDSLHLPNDVLVEQVLLLIDVGFRVNFSLHVHHSLLDLLIKGLHVELGVIESLVYGELLSLVFVLDLLHSLVDVGHVDFEVVVLFSLVSNFVLDGCSCFLFEQVYLVFKLFNGIFKFL